MKVLTEKLYCSAEIAAAIFQLGVSPCSKVTVDVPARRRMIIHHTHITNSSYADQYFYLSFPRMRFEMIYFENSETSFMPLALHCGFLDEQGNLCYPYLPNIMANLRVYLSFDRSYPSIENMMEETLQLFWHSQFNYDMVDTIAKYVPLTPADHPSRSHIGRKKISEFLANWQTQTKLDRKWVPEEFIQLTGSEGYPGRRPGSIIPTFPKS